MEHTEKPMEMKIAGKSSVQILLDSCSPHPVPFLLLKSFLAPRAMLWMLETCPTGHTNHCRSSLPSTWHQCTDGDLQHIPAIHIHAHQRSLIWVYFAFSFLEVCSVLSAELGMSRAGVAMPVLEWGLQQELRSWHRAL